MGEKELSKVLENYECEEQMNIEEWLWDIGYFLPLPFCEGEEKCKTLDRDSASNVTDGC